MADIEVKTKGQVAADAAAKVLSNGDNIPKILDGLNLEKDEAMAPPSTPTREGDVEKDAKELPTTPKREAREKIETFPHFPKFRVTWDSTKPSLMSLKSPGKMRRRGSQSAMVERPTVLMAQEMSPQAALVEFIATSASYHGVRRQTLTELEDDLFRVFRNNVMPANAAAWYMAKRRFFHQIARLESESTIT